MLTEEEFRSRLVASSGPLHDYSKKILESIARSRIEVVDNFTNYIERTKFKPFSVLLGEAPNEIRAQIFGLTITMLFDWVYQIGYPVVICSFYKDIQIVSERNADLVQGKLKLKTTLYFDKEFSLYQDFMLAKPLKQVDGPYVAIIEALVAAGLEGREFETVSTSSV